MNLRIIEFFVTLIYIHLSIDKRCLIILAQSAAIICILLTDRARNIGHPVGVFCEAPAFFESLGISVIHIP